MGRGHPPIAAHGKVAAFRPMRSRRRHLFVLAAVVALGVGPALATAVPAGAAAAVRPATSVHYTPQHYPAGGPNDPSYAPVERDTSPTACATDNVNDEQHYLYSYEPKCATNADDPGGAAGMSVDKAWSTYTTGDPRVVMAYVEAGINWHSASAKDLVDRVYLNTGELPLPDDAQGHPHGTYDLDGNGIVNAADYVHDPRVHDSNKNGYIDPEDLIVAFSNGKDDDHDGFVDDISGWDFYDHQNDPATYDGTYEHSDDQMKQAAATGNNNYEGVGVCPNCMIMPIKAGAEALDRTDDLAQAWLFACHMGASVVISVTADLGYSSYMNQAIQYCWNKGVVMAESSNDFDSLDHQGGQFHAFVLPGNGEVPNTFGYDVEGNAPPIDDAVINADTTKFDERSDETSWGPHAMFSAATQGGSTSESTPTVGGSFGLLLSYGKEAADQHVIASPLTGDEAIQVMRATADPITDTSLNWPGSPGEWNDQYGYGRPNLYKAMTAVNNGDIPPEGWLTSPAWDTLHDPTRESSLDISGVVEAPRSPSYTWNVAYGLTPPRDCSSFTTEPTTWTTIGSGSGTTAYDGHLATLDLSQIPKSFYAAPYALSKCKQFETSDQYTVTVRLTVTDASGRVALDRRAFYAEHDSTQLPGFPLAMTPAHPVTGMTIDGTSEPAYADLQGRGDLAMLYGDADGWVHAIDPKTRKELPGWPVHTNATVPDHQWPGIDPGHEPVLTPVSVGDLFHTGQLDVVVTTTTGRTYVFGPTGKLLPGWPKALSAGVVTPAIPRPDDSFTRLPHLGATADPVLADLTGTHQLDVIQAGWDGEVNVWTPAGHELSGWPVKLDPSLISVEPGDTLIHDYKIDASPAIAYLDGTGKPDVVVASQFDSTPGAGIQLVEGAGSTYAFSSTGKLLSGWPSTNRALVVYYGSAQEFLTEGSTAPVSARISGSTDSVAVSPGIFSVTYELGANGSPQTVLGPEPNPATFFSVDPTQVAMGNLPADLPVTFTTSGAFGKVGSLPDLSYAQAGNGAASVAAGLLLNGSGTAIKDYERAYDAQTGAVQPDFPQQTQGLDFLGEPLVAPVTATGGAAIVDGGDSSALMAMTQTGQLTGFPKWTTGWTVFSPSAGDALSNGTVTIAAATREGYLNAWQTAGSAVDNTQWWSYQHDELAHRPLRRGHPPTGRTAQGPATARVRQQRRSWHQGTTGTTGRSRVTRSMRTAPSRPSRPASSPPVRRRR